MIFRIDRSVSEFCTSGSATAQDLEALGYLALGAAEGSHRITGERRVLKALAQLPSLDLRTRGAFARAAGRTAEEGQMHSKLHTFGQVVVNAQTSPSSAISGAQRVITFPLRWFDSSAKIQATTLLAENLSDVEVLLKIGEAGTILANIGYLPLAACRDNGGGSTIRKVLDQHAMGERICLCVVDSDKASPESAVGGTARSVEPYKDASIYPLIEVSELSGRELENALPDLFFSTKYGTHFKYAQITNLLVQLTNGGEIEVRSHLDIKSGFSLHYVWSLPAGSPGRKFWLSKLEVVSQIVGASIELLPCMTTSHCPHEDPNTCVCVIVPGNRANVLDDFLQWHKTTDRYPLCTYLDISTRAEWVRLGRSVASWCCGDARLRV
jgi:hypothetical protein